MKKEALTYAQAIDRLEAIVRELEGGETSVDELGDAVKEGVRLVQWCRRQLKTAQDEVEAALNALDNPTAESPARGPSRKGATKASTPTPPSGATLFASEVGDMVGEEGLEPPTSSV